MMTVHEVSKLAGVSIRTLQYYDKIGLMIRLVVFIFSEFDMKTWEIKTQ